MVILSWPASTQQLRLRPPAPFFEFSPPQFHLAARIRMLPEFIPPLPPNSLRSFTKEQSVKIRRSASIRTGGDIIFFVIFYYFFISDCSQHIEAPWRLGLIQVGTSVPKFLCVGAEIYAWKKFGDTSYESVSIAFELIHKIMEIREMVVSLDMIIVVVLIAPVAEFTVTFSYVGWTFFYHVVNMSCEFSIQ
uniref:Transmembrane protein n=1 Tax=Caenorhabditis tropicalis TaxID=1561998 RepID=A0A1I7U7R8_9PELO